MLVIRKARKEDKEELAVLHKASIGRLCAKAYGTDLIRGWLDVITTEAYDNALKHLVFIVVAGPESLLGFGMLDCPDSMIKAVYVAPDQAGKGIGTRILTTLERLAGIAGVNRLSIFATLNAEGFYRRHGYLLVRKATHTLPNGTCLPCLKMDKPSLD